MSRPEFVRFEALTEIGFVPGRRGLLLAAIDAARDIDRSHPLLPALQEHLQWFSDNLPRPPDAYTHAESWFIPSAAAHIARARSLAKLLGQLNLPIRERRCTNPGEVVYQDDFQIVAKPEASADSHADPEEGAA